AMPIGELVPWVVEMEGGLDPVRKVIAAELLKEIRDRLTFLLNVGLHYLTLDRSAPTLSGGETQRIRLAGQIGSGLVGVLYILDEPSIGLHPRDNERLLRSLEKLRDMGNTVLVVEHDEETMAAADYLVDFGPGPGTRNAESKRKKRKTMLPLQSAIRKPQAAIPSNASTARSTSTSSSTSIKHRSAEPQGRIRPRTSSFSTRFAVCIQRCPKRKSAA